MQEHGTSSPVRVILGLALYGAWVIALGGVVLFIVGRLDIAIAVAVSTGLLAAPALNTLILGPRSKGQRHGGLIALQRALLVLMTTAMCLTKIISVIFLIWAELVGSKFLARISLWFEEITDWLDDQREFLP